MLIFHKWRSHWLQTKVYSRNITVKCLWTFGQGRCVVNAGSGSVINLVPPTTTNPQPPVQIENGSASPQNSWHPSIGCHSSLPCLQILWNHNFYIVTAQPTPTQYFVTAQPTPTQYFVTAQPTPTRYFVTAQPTSTWYFVTAQPTPILYFVTAQINPTRYFVTAQTNWPQYFVTANNPMSLSTTYLKHGLEQFKQFYRNVSLWVWSNL